MTYTIGEAAKEFGIAASAIRYYDSLGILPGLTRKGGTRIFDEKGMERLRLIECYKLSGMNMREIVAIFAMIDEKRDAAKRREIFHNKHNTIIDMIEELKETEKILRYKCWIYDRAVEMGIEDVTQVLDYVELPEDIAEGKELLSKRHHKGGK